MHGLPVQLTSDQLREILALPPEPTNRMLLRDLEGRTVIRPTGPPDGKSQLMAAVLVLFYPGAAGPTLVLTRRTSHLPTHAGQCSFAGGRVDPEDATLFGTALREAKEELGIDTTGLVLLGQLRPVYVDASNFLIHPFVVMANGRPDLHPNPDEVEAVLEVPLRTLLDPATHQSEVRELRGARFTVPFFRFGQDGIWGATAAMLEDLVSRVERWASSKRGG